MSKLFKLSALALFALISAFALANVNPTAVSAHNGEDHGAEAAEQTTAATMATYSYTAQPGDSYTKIARKAVQTYGIVKQVNLSQAQIIAAETYLTRGAGSPSLSTGDKVEVKEADVEAAVKKAQGLSEAAQKLWQKYVAGVNFNTDKVGQA